MKHLDLVIIFNRYFHVKRLSYGSNSSSGYPSNNNPPEPYTYVTPSGTYVVSEHLTDANGTTKSGHQVRIDSEFIIHVHFTYYFWFVLEWWNVCEAKWSHSVLY